MPRLFPGLLLCLLLVSAMGCDTSGIHPIGNILDPTITCDPGIATSTWIRQMTDGSGDVLGTELLVLGWRPDDPLDQGLDTSLDPTERCMARFKIWGSTTTEEHIGTVELDGLGNGTMTERTHCSFPMEPGPVVLKRRGSDCFDLTRGDETEEVPFTFNIDSSGASDILEVDFPAESDVYRFDLDGAEPYAPEMDFRLPAGTYRYMKINDLANHLASAVDLEQEVNAFDVWRLFHISLVTSQGRLKAFGSGGMTQYLNTLTEYQGFVSSTFTVIVEDVRMPRNTLSYSFMEDLTGILIGGDPPDPQVTIVDYGGNGGMEGGLNFELRVDPDDPAGALVGYLSYENTEVNRGFGNGGTFDLTLEGTSYDTVPWQLSVPQGMGYDVMVPGYGHFKFDVSNLDPNL